MKLIDQSLLAELSAEAQASPRLRKNHNLHERLDEPFQRLVNALEPGTYIRPHRHQVNAKPESFVGLRGRLALVLFDDQGTISEIVPFGPAEPVLGADLPASVWHTVVSLEPGSAFFEAKPGPYTPIAGDDAASWAPAEGTPEAGRLVAQLEAAARERLSSR